MIAAAKAVLHEQLVFPTALVHNHLHPGMSAEDRSRGIEAMHAEDEALEAAGNDLVRRALEAAFTAATWVTGF